MSHEALRRQLSASDNERKYQLISRATIRLFAESRGLTVSDDSIRVLAEDVNYRLREVVSEAAKYMRQTPYQHLTSDHISHAVRDANVDALNDTAPIDKPAYLSLPEQKLFTTRSRAVDLEDYVESSGSDDVGSSRPELIVQSTSSWLEPGAANPPTPGEKLSVDDSKHLEEYFRVLTQSISGDDLNLRQVALADLICNTNVTHVQDQLLLFISHWVTNSVSSGVNVKEALETLDALTNNQAVVLYKQCQMDLLVELLVDRICMINWCSSCIRRKQEDQLYAARILYKCLKWDLPICHHISQKIVSRCKTILLSYEDSSQAEITGAVILLSTLKPEMLAEVPEFCHSSVDNESIDDDRLFIVSLLMDSANTLLKKVSPKAPLSSETLQYLSLLQDKLSCQTVCRLVTPPTLNVKLETHKPVTYLHRNLRGRQKKSRSSPPVSEWFPDKITLTACKKGQLLVNYGTPSSQLKKARTLFPAKYFDSEGADGMRVSEKVQKLYVALDKKLRKTKVPKYRTVYNSTECLMNVVI